MTNTSTSNKFRRQINKPIEVILKRNSSFESRHLAHAVVSDNKGRILMYAGNYDFETFIRSSLKPFQAIPFITSGTCERYNITDKGIAITCGSHSGSTFHSREVFKILWNCHLEVENLKCPIPEGGTSRLQHNCSGKHAAFLATCKKMEWPLETYLDKKHPIQSEIIRIVSELLTIPAEEFITANDDCGAPVLHLRLSQMAYLYAKLSSSESPELEKIKRAIIGNPFLIAGEGKFDTELISRGHGQIISKGGSEGIQCICRVREGLGVAIKVEDGSKRAKHAVALQILKQLDWITPTALEELSKLSLSFKPGVEIEVQGKLKFQET